MTVDEALADLDARFERHVAEETARMKAAGLGQAVIDAINGENRARFAAHRTGAAAWAVSPPGNDKLATTRPLGSA